MTPQKMLIGLAGAQYELTVTWCVPMACWTVDIRTTDGVAILTGIPVVTGADLLEQFTYVGIGGQLFAQTDNSPDTVPTYESLGTTGHLYFVSPPSV